jgi:hypothetical protein
MLPRIDIFENNQTISLLQAARQPEQKNPGGKPG